MTVAANCCVCPELRFALDGLIDIDNGPSETVEETDLVGSATLVAVTVTEVWVGIAAGAVNKPEVRTVPRLGFTVQVTLVFGL